MAALELVCAPALLAGCLPSADVQGCFWCLSPHCELHTSLPGRFQVTLHSLSTMTNHSYRCQLSRCCGFTVRPEHGAQATSLASVRHAASNRISPTTFAFALTLSAAKGALRMGSCNPLPFLLWNPTLRAKAWILPSGLWPVPHRVTLADEPRQISVCDRHLDLVKCLTLTSLDGCCVRCSA